MARFLRRLWLVLILFAIPSAGYYAAAELDGPLKAELKPILVKQENIAADRDLDDRERVVLYQKLGPARTRLETRRNLLGIVKYASVGAIALGLTMLGGIAAAGFVSRIYPRVLVAVFTPGWRLTAACLIALIAIHAVVLLAGLWYAIISYAPDTFFRPALPLTSAIALGAVAGIYSMAHRVVAVVWERRGRIGGISVRPNEAPKLWSHVKQASTLLGSDPPDNIVLCLDSIFGVTSQRAVCVNGRLEGRTLCLSLPMLRILSIDEALAVVGHELGHVKGEEPELYRDFGNIYDGAAAGYASLLETAKKRPMKSIPLRPAIAMIGYFLEQFLEAAARVKRACEFAADQEGARLKSVAVNGAVLVKSHAFMPVWRKLVAHVFEQLQLGEWPPNLSLEFANSVASVATPEFLAQVDNTRSTDPFDSHPSVFARLEALGMTVEDVSTAALEVTRADAAIQLVPHAEEYEVWLTQACLHLFASQLGIPFKNLGLPPPLPPWVSSSASKGAS